MATSIKLERGVWNFDEGQRLGKPGGFGEVFRGQGEIGNVAIKRLKLTASAAAHREMNIAKALANRTLAHVVPILDYGQDADTDRYYLVMPICNYSLQDLIDQERRLAWERVKPTALDIIAGLAEVQDIVHRDLKPANVLRLNDRWRISDFGIAKFVEDSTSLETLRDSLTPTYAAPEQWLGEAPTRATDIYALGCILHAMINGSPPFEGDIDSIRKGHLAMPPPPLRDCDPRLSGLVHTMLRKSAQSRPSLDRCMTVTTSIATETHRPSREALFAAGNAIAQEEAAAEAKRQTEERERRERASLAAEAIAELKMLLERLFSEIAASSESVRRKLRSVSLGPAQLMYDEPEAIAKSEIQNPSAYAHGWDIAACCKLSLRAELDRQSAADPATYTFAATLVFASTKEDQDFRWRELSFFNWRNSEPLHLNPVVLNPKLRDFQLAISKVASGWQLAHGPFPIDGESEDSFQERWISLFAKAASRKLRPPTHLPLKSDFFQTR